MLNLVLIRHAQSLANARREWPSRENHGLSDVGRRQAELCSKRLEREAYAPTHIYASPLGRAIETASIAASTWDVPIEPWEDLIENDVGVFSGLTWSEIESRYPEVAEEFTESWSMDVVPHAETHGQLKGRARRVVDFLVSERRNDHRVFMVTHGGIMHYIVGELIGTDSLWSFEIRNTAIFEFTIDRNSWHLCGQSRANNRLWRINRFGDAAHLG